MIKLQSKIIKIYESVLSDEIKNEIKETKILVSEIKESNCQIVSEQTNSYANIAQQMGDFKKSISSVQKLI